jgi:hypothetical protein
MRRVATMARALGAALAIAGSTACLDPLVTDDVPLEDLLGAPGLDPDAAPAVEDDPAVAARLPAFTRSVAYLNGFAGGEAVRYWNADGEQSDVIAPFFELVDAAGTILERPVVDVLPGEPGYTPWWRRVVVRTTARYAGEKLWSRAAIEAAVEAGLVEPPVPTEDVIDAPVALESVRVPLGEADRAAAPEPIWYRGQRARWIRFSDVLRVPVTERRMPRAPVYVMQRIDEGAPLYELLSGVDLDGDAQLDDTSNVFAARPGEARYSPLWFVVLVRVAADFRSIERGRPEITAERQLVDASGTLTSSRAVSLTPLDAFLVNCPIQRTRGAL